MLVVHCALGPQQHASSHARQCCCQQRWQRGALQRIGGNSCHRVSEVPTADHCWPWPVCQCLSMGGFACRRACTQARATTGTSRPRALDRPRHRQANLKRLQRRAPDARGANAPPPPPTALAVSGRVDAAASIPTNGDADAGTRGLVAVGLRPGHTSPSQCLWPWLAQPGRMEPTAGA